jgi:beta-N-acetylglucosaminidase/Concanavalin A-like lectin/glucanases superfamily/Hyaluronidase post-catalytic domain-like/Glycosyl hydrolase family 20, domain 2
MRGTARSARRNRSGTWRRAPLAAAIAVVMAGAAAAAVTAPATAARAAAGPVPVISPTPQSERPLSAAFALTPVVGVVTTAQTDPATVTLVDDVLRQHGVTDIRQTSNGSDPAAPVTIWVGGPQENPASARALAALGVQGPQGLPAEGYVLAAGRGGDGGAEIVLSGVDRTGTFYAAQSFRQIISRRAGRPEVAGVSVRDWPAFGIRGGMQSFYGPAWSEADDLQQIQFLAAHKMNTFFYGPAGDPQTDQTWNVPYPPQQLSALATIVAASRRRHVNFIYRISPEDPLDPAAGICHSDRADLQELLTRLEQVYSIGVRAFTIAWDDVAGTFTCPSDQQQFGADPSPEAAAQAYVDNWVLQHFIQANPGNQPLLTVPTQYYGDGPSTYRTRFDQLVDPSIRIFWTGPAVVSPSIQVSDIEQAQQAFPDHKLLIWDNYPVNDYSTGRLMVGPLVNRQAGLEHDALGITFNEMQEEAPSLIPLFTEADFAWNPERYNAQQSWDRALRELGGRAYAALKVFAQNNMSSPLDAAESPVLSPLITSAENAFTQGQDISGAAARLERAFGQLARAPGQLRSGLRDQLFLTEAGSWLDKLGDYGQAGLAATDALVAQAAGQPSAAWQDRQRLDGDIQAGAAISQTVAPGVIDPYQSFVTGQDDGFMGAGWYGGTGAVTGTPAPAAGSSLAAAADGNLAIAYTAGSAPEAGDALTVALQRPRALGSVVVLQSSAAPASGEVQVQGQDGSWTSLGSLHGGYTSLSGHGAVAGQIRILWAAGTTPPSVYEVIPQYADVLPATLSASPSGALTTPGKTKSFTLRLSGIAPAQLSGTLSVSVPAGLTAAPASQAFSIASNDRVVSTSFTISVTPSATAAPGSYPVAFTATAADGRAVSADATVEVGTASAQSYPDLVLSHSPGGYWRLGDSSGTVAADSSGHGDPGTYETGVTLAQPGPLPGSADASALFDGGYVSVPNSAAISPTGPFTLEAWVKPASVVPAPGPGIIEKYDTPAYNGYALRLDGSNRVQAWILGASSYVNVTGSTVLPVGQWSYVAAVYDGHSLTVYVNGMPDGSVATTLNPAAGQDSMKIGARGDDANERFDGNLAEVAIYGQALSPQQIATDYLTGTGG